MREIKRSRLIAECRPRIMHSVGAVSGSKTVGYGNGSELLLLSLRFKLLGPVNMSVGDFDPVNDHPDASDHIGGERFFVDALAVPESVSVQQDIVRDRFSVDAEEKMNADAVKQTEKTGIGVIEWRAAVGSWTDQVGSEIVGDVPSKTHLAAQIGAGIGVAEGDPRMGNAVKSKSS